MVPPLRWGRVEAHGHVQSVPRPRRAPMIWLVCTLIRPRVPRLRGGRRRLPRFATHAGILFSRCEKFYVLVGLLWDHVFETNELV